ncbi:hypothetical protein [Pantoea sp. MBLJ3]|uniref:hypothetical protein n=1 Tax=Pantoea sp. MBLJ3 TaxID=1562889 RepID=UPI00057CD47E|nr:hypothetical protein [Pantoea sp. MBLJ3]
MFEFSQKQRLNFLMRFGLKTKVNAKEVFVIPERTTNSDNGQVTEELYVTANSDDVKQGYIIELDGETYKIAYINNDNSGLVNCYLSITSKEQIFEPEEFQGIELPKLKRKVSKYE